MGIDNPVHLIFLGAIALVVLGPKRIPELARSLGNGIREFRESMSEAVSGDEHSAAAASAPVISASPAVSAPVVSAAPAVSAAVASQQPAQLAAPAESVDPAQPVRSDDAPDRRPL